MRIALFFVLVCFFLNGKANPDETRIRQLEEKLRCLVCQNQSLADSGAELAGDLRKQVRDQVAAGRSDDEIIDFLVQRYGDFVRYEPPFKASTALLWIGPFVLLAAGAGLLLAALRRRRNAPEEPALGPEDKRLVERVLGPAERVPGPAERMPGSTAPDGRESGGAAMTLFWALAAALTAAALAMLLPPLLRRRATPPDARVAANAAIYHEQLEELGAELQRGAIGQEEFERASREIERRIVAEHAGGGGPEPALRRAPVAAAVAVGLLVPLFAGLGYWQLGEPRALSAQALRSADPQELQALVQRLASQLEKSPQDVEGWSLLGRALASLGRHGQAAQAFARAVQLAPENRDLLVEFVQGLALAGRVEFEQRNYAAAIGYWERILPFAPPDSEFARNVAESIAEAKTLAGAAPAAPAPAAAPAKAAAAGSLQGVVSLDPALKGKLKPDAVVFIVARPAEAGAPRMPLAVARTTVSKLPYRFALDDSMAMAPGVKLSGHARVVVVARVSQSGTAVAQKGDVEGSSAPVAPTARDVNVVISKTVD